MIKSKAFTARFVLERAWPGLLAFVLTFIWPHPLLYAFAAGAITTGLVFILWQHRTLPLILAALMLAPHAQAQSRPKTPAGACALFVVVVAAGYLYVKVVKACKNLKPRVLPDDEDGTNAPPKDMSGPQIGLSQAVSPSYCCGDQPKSDFSSSIELEFDGASLKIRPSRSTETVSTEEFNRTIENYGLNPEQAGNQYFPPGGITFTDTGVIVAGANARRILLQKSRDLQTWEDFADVTAPPSLKLRFTDATLEPGEPARFYRIVQ